MEATKKTPLAAVIWMPVMQRGPNFTPGPNGTGEGELGGDEHFPLGHL